MKLWGKEFTKDELLKRVGNISQIGGIKQYQLQDGREKGVSAIDFKTGTGFKFTVLPGRGMDIASCEYKSIPLAWISPTGIVSPYYFEPEGTGFLRSFFGGLLTTCGLTYLGRPCVDGGKKLGLHGRISNIPAGSVCVDEIWENNDYIMSVKGKMYEVSNFEENICLERKIQAKMGENRLFIQDKIENLGYQNTEHMILYHFNFGFPLIDKNVKLILPPGKTKPRNGEAEKERWNRFSLPIPGYKEKCYYHNIEPDKNGSLQVSIENKNIGIRFYIKYFKNELPCLIQWKMMGQGMYVLGVEPSNCLVEGRAKERKSGKLQFLKPGESRRYNLEAGIEQI